MKNYDGKAKMYLQEDNAGFSILVTNGRGSWYSWEENELPVKFTNSETENVRILQEAINAGAMWNAREFVEAVMNDTNMMLNHFIARLRGCVNANDVARIINSEFKTCDFVAWYPVWREV